MKKKAGLTDLRHPMQPLGLDEYGVLRFKPNRLVDALLEHGQKTGLGLNELRVRFGTREYKEDHVQLAQLIGYSLSGFGELSFVDNATYATAHEMAGDKMLTPLKPGSPRWRARSRN